MTCQEELLAAAKMAESALWKRVMGATSASDMKIDLPIWLGLYRAITRYEAMK